MALNMSDPAAVMSAYSSILDNENNWLLLHYVNRSFDELGLHSYGKEGLEEMKTKLSDLNQVFIAFYREEVDVNPGYIIINYVPPPISGVRRARALVHSRRVGAILKKHQTIFTVDNLSLITADNVYQAIKNPHTAFPSPLHEDTNKALPEPHDVLAFDPVEPPPPLQPLRAATNPAPKPIVRDMARRSFTATYAPQVTPPHVPPVPPLPKGGSIFTNLLRRKKKTDDPAGAEDMLPPPTPPKDKGKFHVLPVGLSYSQPAPSTERVVRRQRSHSMSDFAVISHAGDSDELVIVEPERNQLPPKDPSQLYSLPLRGKWSNDAALPSDPAERAQRRRELRLQREQEERAAMEEEAERQRQIKLQKEALLRQEIEEENRRKADVEEEIRRITAERRRREQMEKEEDERKRRELEERKRLDKDRRLEEHRRLEQWRMEQAKKAEAAARQAAEVRRQEEAERKKKIQQAEAKVKQTRGESDLTGWITILSKDSLSWKRRFYKFVGNAIFLYRNPKDMSTALEKVDLRGNVRALKEWNEGYDDLEAIVFSFVVEFKDGRGHWSMYADSEEEKYKILGLLKAAGGL